MHMELVGSKMRQGASKEFVHSTEESLEIYLNSFLNIFKFYYQNQLYSF